MPRLPARAKSVTITGNKASFTFLNTTRTSDFPISWSALERDSAHLWSFNLHYMEYLEALEDRDFEILVTDWINGNPPTSKGAWRSSWSAYALSLRVVVWMQQLAKRKKNLGPDFHGQVARSIQHQISHLEHNLEVDVGGNHLLKNIKALLWAGRFFEGAEAERWHRKGKRLLAKELKEQFLPDGLHYERSPAYHCQVFADLIDCWAAIDKDDVGLEQVIHKAAEALAATTHPDGLSSLFNDGGLHMAYAPADLLKTYEKIFGRHPEVTPNIALPHAGYYGYRSDRLYVLADCGDIGPDFLIAHGHGDTLAFELTVDGKRFIVDQGVYEYDPGPKRDLSRATSSHNTVEIAGQSQSDFFGSFRAGRRAHAKCLEYEEQENGFRLVGTHDGYQHLKGAPRHIRSFEVSPDCVYISDKVSANIPYPAKAFILLAPDIEVSETEEGLQLHNTGTFVHLASSAPILIEEAVWFPDFGVEQQTKRIVLDYGFAPSDHSISLTVK